MKIKRGKMEIKKEMRKLKNNFGMLIIFGILIVLGIYSSLSADSTYHPPGDGYKSETPLFSPTTPTNNPTPTPTIDLSTWVAGNEADSFKRVNQEITVLWLEYQESNQVQEGFNTAWANANLETRLKIWDSLNKLNVEDKETKTTNNNVRKLLDLLKPENRKKLLEAFDSQQKPEDRYKQLIEALEVKEDNQKTKENLESVTSLLTHEQRQHFFTAYTGIPTKFSDELKEKTVKFEYKPAGEPTDKPQFQGFTMTIGDQINPLLFPKKPADGVLSMEVRQINSAEEYDTGNYKKQWVVMNGLSQDGLKRAAMLPGTYLAAKEGKLVARGLNGQEATVDLGEYEDIAFRFSQSGDNPIKKEVWINVKETEVDPTKRGYVESNGIRVQPDPKKNIALTDADKNKGNQVEGKVHAYSASEETTNKEGKVTSSNVWGTIKDTNNGLTMSFATPSTYVLPGGGVSEETKTSNKPYLQVLETPDTNNKEKPIKLTGNAPGSKIEVVSENDNPITFTNKDGQTNTVSAKEGDSPIKFTIEEDSVIANRGNGNREVVAQGTQRVTQNGATTDRTSADGNGDCCGEHVSTSVQPVVDNADGATQTPDANQQTTRQTTQRETITISNYGRLEVYNSNEVPSGYFQYMCMGRGAGCIYKNNKNNFIFVKS